MASDSSGLASPPGLASEDDYRSFCAALSETARGRDFLTEYARRNRHADTEMLLAALDRLEALIKAEGTALERLRDELRVLLIALRLPRPAIDAGNPLTKVAKLASLLDLLESRIDAMAEGKSANPTPPADAIPAEFERLPLRVVPPPDEPELPIPSPATAQPPAITLVRNVDLPEVTFVGNAPPAFVKQSPAPATVEAESFDEEPALSALTAMIDFPTLGVVENQAVEPKPAKPASNPLAAIMALSEEERIALFT